MQKSDIDDLYLVTNGYGYKFGHLWGREDCPRQQGLKPCLGS